VIQAADGTLWGTTPFGGPDSDSGVIFQMAPDGSNFTIRHSSHEGHPTSSGLIQAVDGTLYGTAGNSLFGIASDGTGFQVLYSGFDDPSGPLLQASDGTLYGTTVHGGDGDSTFGTIFQIFPDSGDAFRVYSFTGAPTDGANPLFGVIQASDGTLYGTTVHGGASDLGAIFQMAPDGSDYAVLHSFTGGATDGANPQYGVIQASDGTLYGTTLQGGVSGLGTVFRMAPDGSDYAVLHSFTGGATDGASPSGLIQALDGVLYGTTFQGGTSNQGTVFRLR
jgi:uncharacterized repeat protein (TIGR03803 family)